ncbi:MAG: hypothetical protein ACUVTD_01985 [Nitrososphaerales archaeon]
MYSLVLDPSSLIPCGEKSEEEKEAIRKLGSILYKTRYATIYLSSYLVKIYKTKVAPLLEQHHQLPPFHVSLLNLLPQFIKISTISRGSLCKTISPEIGIKFHILETTRIQCYDINNIGLTEDEDKEVLRITLAATHQETFLVTTDRNFLENLNWTKLSKKYPNESQKIKIVKPNNPGLITVLVKK